MELNRIAVDLDKKLTFPEIVPTNFRPEMVLWSPGTKKVNIIIEPTVS